MKRLLTATALLGLAACSGGGSGLQTIPRDNRTESSPTATNHMAMAHHRTITLATDAEVEKDLPQDVRGDDRKTMRALLKRLPKASRRALMFFGQDDHLYAVDHRNLKFMQLAHKDPNSKYANFLIGTDGRHFTAPADDPKPDRSASDENTERAIASNVRAPMLAAGQRPSPTTDSGPFRRIYSYAGESWQSGDLDLPCDNATFQTDGVKDIEGGYAYGGGWGIGAAGPAIDAGFQRSSNQGGGTNYFPFVRVEKQTYKYSSQTIPCGKTVHYEFDSPTISAVQLRVTTSDGSVPEQIAGDAAQGWAPDSGGTVDGIVLKRMTTIAQPIGYSNPNSQIYNPDWYDDGSQWGFLNGLPAVRWYNSQIGYYADNSSTSTLYYDTWSSTYTWGYQRFPDDGTRVVVNPFVSSAEETDAINLHYP